MRYLKNVLVILITFTIFLFSNSNLVAQNNPVKAHQKVISAFGQEHVSQLMNQYPDSVRYYNFMVENSYTITQKENLNSQINYSGLSEISINNDWIREGKVDFLKFNILMLSIKPDLSQNKYFRITGTYDVLMIRSLNYIQKKIEGYSPEK